MNNIPDQEIIDSLSDVITQIQVEIAISIASPAPPRSRFAAKIGAIEELAEAQRAEVARFLRDALDTYHRRAQDRWSRGESISPDIMWRVMIAFQ